jgi:hypothetical protein
MRASTSNILFSEMIKVIKKLEPSIIHQCPYREAIVDGKIPDVSSMPSIFSSGCYKTFVNITSKKDEMIITFEAIVDWISSEKSSYG